MKTGNTFACLGLLGFMFVADPVIAQITAEFTSNIQSGCGPLIVAFQDKSTGNPTEWKWTLGNGVTSTLQNPVTTYFDPGVYIIKLVVKNSSGSDSVTKVSYITVHSNPTADFFASPTQGCYPLQVDFTDNSAPGSGMISGYLWDLGDGNLSTDQKPSHIYTSAGVFDITLKVTNSLGCSNTITKNDLIRIDNGVNAAFQLTSVDVCKTPATATFENLSSGSGSLTYKWAFGDRTTSTDPSPKHNYKTAGTYNVILTAQSSEGCSDTASMSLTIAFPSSSFTNTYPCSGQAIYFKNTSVPLPVSTTWYFGDSTTSTELDPVKTYADTGNYEVKLVNMFSSSCSDSITKIITIASGPSASFFAEDTAQCTAPLTVRFTNRTTGAVSSYIWDFGDGVTSSAINPTHTYTGGGEFTVTLTAINSNGCATVFQKADYVDILPVQITGIANLPDSGCIPLAIQPEVQLNIGAKIKSYKWDFGDSTTSSSATPIHIYIKEGFFDVKVTIETFDGCIDTFTMYNAVLAGHVPKANFISTFDSICASETLVFQNTSTNGPITFLQWDYREIVDSAHGQYHYVSANDTGYRHVTLIAFNYGCTDTIFKERQVYVLPPISRMDYFIDCDNKLSVDFIDSSSLDIGHIWDFGDGKTDTARNPRHTYDSAGVYTVNLYTTNKSCKDTATSVINVFSESGAITLASNIYCRGNTMVADLTGIDVSNIEHTRWDFGDGTVVTVNGGTEASHKYQTAGKFLITATMTDLNGCDYAYEAQDSITVLGPLAKFISVQLGACQGGSVSFTDKSETDSVHDIVRWEWDYGDKVNRVYSDTTNFQHTYPDTGYYTVRLTVTDTYGCSDSIWKTDYVYISHPYASFVVQDSIACPDGQVAFQNTSTGTGLESFWEFGDGSESSQTSPFYTYNNLGVYVPKLFVTDINGCRDSFLLDALRIASPAAMFSMSDSFSTCPPLQVNFTNRSKDYEALNWYFGDGSTSALTSPSHLYTYPGVYLVKLIAHGYGSCADTLKRTVIIDGPIGTLTYDSKPVCYPGVLQVSANSPNTASYTWDFRDGTTITTLTNKISHVYDVGFYVPQMILTDSLGCKVLIKGNDTVKVFDISADALLLGNPACDSSLVQFIDQSSSGDSIIHHLWYFGDKDSADASMVNHMYPRVGTYNARLVAVTLSGCRDTLDIPEPVIIFPAPQISILGDSVACALTTVDFDGMNNAEDSSGTSWHWDFGNGFAGAGQSGSANYLDGGFYTITLTAVNSRGCSDTTSKLIRINGAPAVDAGPDTAVCKNSAYELTAAGAETYRWTGEGLSCTNCQSPDIKTDTSAFYTVTGTDALGCKASDTVYVRVIGPTNISVSAGDTLCVGESTQLLASGAYSYQWYPSVYLDNNKSSQPVFKPLQDTSINFQVIGYTEQNCFSDTGYVFVKVYPLPQMDIIDDEITLDVGSSVRLRTNSSGDVIQWQWQPPAGLDDPNNANPLAFPKQTTKYVCIATNGGSCVARDEITINVVCKNTNVFIPNTFSPNKDGMNDVFFPRGKGLFNIRSFRIFNRWGQLIFERFNVSPNNPTGGWDGSHDGQIVNSDVYVYMMEIVCENNTVIPIKGNITLLK